MKKYILKEELSFKKMPTYMKHYTYKNEDIYKMYKTKRDRAVFTDTRMILFDLKLFTKYKLIQVIPYKTILSGEVFFKKRTGFITLKLYNNSIKLKFIKLCPEDKTELRKLFYHIMRNVK